MRPASIVLFLALNSGPAHAQLVHLVCGGSVIVVEPRPFEDTVPPTTTTIDLTRRTIATPVGTYAISNVRDDSISFEGTQSHNRVAGQLDRHFGKMAIAWRKPEEQKNWRQA